MPDGICSADGCEKPLHARGWCQMHYRRYRRSGDFVALAQVQTNGLSDIHRFMSKVALPDDPDDCWLWTASHGTDDGWTYGRFFLNRRLTGAHRAAYEMFVGPIPPGLYIDHICRNTMCVNPRHLRTATNKQNQQNRKGAARNSKSGILGVTWKTEKSRWQVDVTYDGVHHYGGKFRDLHDAEAAAIALRNQLFTHNDADHKISA